MRPAITGRVKLQMRLSETVHEKMKAIAEYESRSLNSLIEFYCRQGVERFEREHCPVKTSKQES